MSDASNVTTIESQEGLDEIVESYDVVVVDCWAPWCGPCQTIKPHFHDLMDSYSDREEAVIGVSANIEEAPDIPQAWGVRSIPTFLGFRDGDHVETVTTSQSDRLEEWVKSLVESGGD